MLKVKTKIGPSNTHGTGLFADQFIPKGTTTWEWDPTMDISLDVDFVESLPSIQKEYLLYYMYLDQEINKLILCSDNQRYINHSKNINIDSTPRRDVANRDIQPGEEFLCDYNLFDNTYFKRIGLDETTLN